MAKNIENNQQQQVFAQQQVSVPPTQMLASSHAWMNWLTLVIIPVIGLTLTAYSLFKPNNPPPPITNQYGTQIPSSSQPNNPPPYPSNNPNIPNITELPPPHHPGDSNTPEWAYRTIVCRGESAFADKIPAQEAINMAKEIAENQATRELMDQMYDLPIDTEMTIRDFVMRHPNIDTKIRKIIENIKPSKRNLGTKIEVDLELSLNKIWKVIEPVYRADKK